MIRNLIAIFLVASLSYSLAKADTELEVRDVKLGVTLRNLDKWIDKPCRLVKISEETIEVRKNSQIKICTLRDDVDLLISGSKVNKGIFRFYNDELFHAAFDFKKTCDCFEGIAASLAYQYGEPSYTSLDYDLIRYERVATKINFHQLAGTPRLWWYHLPLLVKANTLISSFNLDSDEIE